MLLHNTGSGITDKVPQFVCACCGTVTYDIPNCRSFVTDTLQISGVTGDGSEKPELWRRPQGQRQTRVA
ncbi:hypothetical protein Anapl_12343 [Anas platyrhynchos]|uniref:Uncharacterized protein n=1 Tax=Anas platyrhynchos TaxID=8839 RepID=R0K3E7_ANAPL|nr:hypothetical protein Anapl_12343 [Anas platyrhynchos]